MLTFLLILFLNFYLFKFYLRRLFFHHFLWLIFFIGPSNTQFFLWLFLFFLLIYLILFGTCEAFILLGINLSLDLFIIVNLFCFLFLYYLLNYDRSVNNWTFLAKGWFYTRLIRLFIINYCCGSQYFCNIFLDFFFLFFNFLLLLLLLNYFNDFLFIFFMI